MNFKSTASNRHTSRFTIDKRNLEERIRQIEASLQPLINHMVTPNEEISMYLKTGKSKNVHNLVEFLSESVSHFTQQTNSLSDEYPEIKVELNLEINRFKTNGNRAIHAAAEFAQNPSKLQTRKSLADASRDLLTALARILALVGMIDEHLLMEIVENLKASLAKLKSSRDESDFMQHLNNYTKNLKDFISLSDRTVKNIIDPNVRNEFYSNRLLLSRQTLFLYSASKTFMKNTKLDAAKTLHEQVFNETKHLIMILTEIITTKTNTNEFIRVLTTDSISIFRNLNEFERLTNEVTVKNYKDSKLQHKIESQLSEAIKKINSYSNQNILNENNSNNILSECKNLSAALQNFYKSFGDINNGLDLPDKHRVGLIKKSKSIKRQLIKMIAEEFCMNNNNELDCLIDAAKSGDRKRLDICADLFSQHASKLKHLALLACSLSTNQSSTELVAISAKRIGCLAPHVISAASILCSNKTSEEAKQNMDIFRNTWINELKLLTLAVDDILSINDFLFVLERRILEDINKSIKALELSDSNELAQYGYNVYQQMNRVCELVQSEINNYEACEFTRKVNGTIKEIRERVLVNFIEKLQFSIKALQTNKDVYENEFIDASRWLFDHIRELRNAFLLLQTDELNFTLEEQIEQEVILVEEESVLIEEEPSLNQTQQIENITEEERIQLDQQIDSFHQEKINFDKEVLKWDDNSNDIILLSKEMCVIMIDMIDFTRGKGKLKTFTDLIVAAKRISEIGSKLEKLAKELAEQCPESQSKHELLNCIKSLPLFCKQLNIGSKVKQNIIDLDNASSLIISAKNLMNSVSSVVKLSYVASTKYTSKTDNKKPLVQWKMKPPELKPLVIGAKQNATRELVRKDSQKVKYNAIKTLSLFEI